MSKSVWVFLIGPCLLCLAVSMLGSLSLRDLTVGTSTETVTVQALSDLEYCSVSGFLGIRGRFVFLTYIHPLFPAVFLGHSGSKLSDTNLKPGNNTDLAFRFLVCCHYSSAELQIQFIEKLDY